MDNTAVETVTDSVGNEAPMTEGQNGETATVTETKSKSKKKSKATEAVRAPSPTAGLREVSGVYKANPDELVIADDKTHPLYDERQHYKRDANKVAWNKVNGMPGTVITAIRSEGKLFVVDGRQRTADLREANRQLRADGSDVQHTIDVRVLAPSFKMEEAADLVDLLNSFTTTDSIMVLARKAKRRVERVTARLVASSTEEAAAKKEAVETTAQIYRCSSQTIRQRLEALTAIQDAQDACEEGKIGFGDLLEISRAGDEAAQRAALETAIAGRVDSDEDDEGEEDEDGEGEEKTRRRKKKAVGRAWLKKVHEEMSADDKGSSAVVALIGYLLGEVKGEDLVKEVKQLAPFVKVRGGKKKAKAEKQETPAGERTPETL